MLSGEQVPARDDRTLMEVGCRLVGTHAVGKTNLSHLLFPSVEVDLDAVEAAFAPHVPVVQLEGSDAQAGGDSGSTSSSSRPDAAAGPLQLLWSGARLLLARLPGLALLFAQPAPPPPPSLLAWHTTRTVLAVAHATSGAVLCYDCAAAAASSSGSVDDVLRVPQQVLTHQLQQQVSSLAWRPVHCSMLAVGCKGGVALWSLGKLPLAASAIHRGGGGPADSQGGWAAFLSFKPGCRVTSLSWSPDGFKLAGSSADCNRIVVWDAALGVGSSLRLGLHPVTLLEWSPDGNYLFAAAASGRFYLYETTSWSLRSWDAPFGAAIIGAAWAPDSSVLLLAMSGCASLVALHLVAPPPALTEQLLPVLLPGVSDDDALKHSNGAGGGASDAPSCVIRGIAWDRSGSRLAVVLGQPHPAAGAVAIFSTSVRPVVTCTPVGYVQPGELPQQAAASAGPAPLQVAFAPAPGRDKAGALLSAGLSGAGGALRLVRNVPMYF